MKGLLSKFTSNAVLNSKNKEQSKSKNSSAIKSMQIDFNNNKQSVSNTFRQIGGVNTKFKTSKNSPEKNLNERNFSQEHNKLILQTKNLYNNNIMVNTNLNNKDTFINTKLSAKPSMNFHINNNAPQDCISEMDYIKNKVTKKKEKTKTNSNYLNYTNPHSILNSSSQPKSNGLSDFSNYRIKLEKKNNEFKPDSNQSGIQFVNGIHKKSESILEEKIDNISIRQQVEDKKIITTKGHETKKIENSEKSSNDFRKPIKTIFSEHILKNNHPKKDNPIIDTLQKPAHTKIDSKDILNNFNKDSRIIQIKESSRKSSIDKTVKNNHSSININGALSKPLLKHSSQSNQNSASTLINTLDTKSTQKINMKSIEKGNIQFQNQFAHQIDIKAVTDYSKKSSPNHKQTSESQSKVSGINSVQISSKGFENKKINNVSNILSVNQQHKKSKSPRIEDKVEFFKRKVEDVKKNSDISNINISTSKTPNIMKNPNGHNNSVNPYKKHSTSTNSPKNMLLNFKKEVVIHNNNNIKENVNYDKTPGKKNNSISSSQRIKDEPNSAGKNMPSLKININNIKQKNNESKKKDLELSKSLDNILETSNCSIKSTLRESNYYRKEAEKLSNYIKSYYKKNNEYPVSNMKFYKYGRLIGKGAFGKVNLSLHISSGRLVAIKSFNKKNLTSENAKKKIFYETKLMKNLRHPSIVKIFEVIENPKYIIIVLEYVYGGDLLSFVRKRTKLNELTAKLIFKQIIEGLKYIHSQNVVHRDIKLDNILIDLNNNIKICDFGVSKIIKKGDIMHDQCGTPAYIAPEILRNQGYEGFSVDIWSAGVVLYAMLSGTVPFKANNMSDLHKLIIKGNPSPLKEVSDEANDLLSGLLEIDPKKRLTVDQILNHPWIKNDALKLKTKMNLFTNAEKVLLSKSNIDFRYANKEDLNENFTLKNLDSLRDTENQNVNTKSYILAPFNSSIKKNDNFLDEELQIENEAIKIIGKAKDANRHYELNNNGEIDNGILINQPEHKDKDVLSNRESPLLSPISNSRDKSKPVSPPNELADRRLSNIPSPKDSSKNNKEEVNPFVIDDSIVSLVEEIGYNREFILKSLSNNELNYAVAAYYLILNSKINESI